MNLIAAIGATDRAEPLFARATDLSDKVFAAMKAGGSNLETLLGAYRKAASALETYLGRGALQRIRGDLAVHARLKAAAEKNVKLAGLMTGIYTASAAAGIVEQAAGVLGRVDPYVLALRGLVGHMSAQQRLIIWAVGEERANEILQAAGTADSP